jgi:hypothetical protein
MSQSQSILEVAFFADFFISINPRYIDVPPFFESDFDTTSDEVFFPICITFAPVSVVCPELAKAIPKCSARELSPFRTEHG